MHPHGEEILVLLSGSMTMIFVFPFPREICVSSGQETISRGFPVNWRVATHLHQQL
jgi:hypothetical protein